MLLWDHFLSLNNVARPVVHHHTHLHSSLGATDLLLPGLPAALMAGLTDACCLKRDLGIVPGTYGFSLSGGNRGHVLTYPLTVEVINQLKDE